MASFEVNRPDIVAEVGALCAGYNKALLGNDVEALVDFFWDDPNAQRVGVTEELYGAEEISAFRKARVVNFSDRKNLKETLVTFGDALAISTVEFSVTVGDAPRHGRQSQVWVKFPDLGWRIVSAHVSHRVTPENGASFSQPAAGGGGKAAAYASSVAAFLGMPVDPEFAPGVVNDLSVMAGIVGPLMELDLSDIEIAPKFTA